VVFTWELFSFSIISPAPAVSLFSTFLMSNRQIPSASAGSSPSAAATVGAALNSAASAANRAAAARYYDRFLEERDEILKHKWIESQKAGEDIGFERALTEWVGGYRDTWRKEREQEREKDKDRAAAATAAAAAEKEKPKPRSREKK
jgi:hypothetical protein